MIAFLLLIALVAGLLGYFVSVGLAALFLVLAVVVLLVGRARVVGRL